MNKKAVFLDRDGVINRRIPNSYVHDWDEFELIPGVIDALRQLTEAGATLFVVTNQRGIARGLVEAAEVEAIHARLSDTLRAAEVDLGGIYTCPHEIGVCDCRKPGVGLFRQALAAHPWIRFGDSEMVGDSISDAEAAQRLGIRVWLVGDDVANVTADAAGKGITIAGTARNLEELVDDTPLLASLRGT